MAKCTAVAKSSGNACKRDAIPGGTVCEYHGGRAPQVIAKARERVLMAELNGQLQELGWEPVTNPGLKLAELAGEIVAFKDMARARVNLLRAWDVKVFGGSEETRATITVYEQALDRAERTLSKMLGHGLTAEALRIAAELPSQEQAGALIAAMDRLLADPRVSITGDPREVVLAALQPLEVAP